MRYVKSLKGVLRADKELVGERAVDLALLAERDFLIPLSFVITNEAFEEFIRGNRLQERIGEALTSKSNPNRVYDVIRELILRAEFPKEMVAEFVEGYESLDVDIDAPLNQMVDTGVAPFLTLFLSPNYTLPAENREGMILNIQGLEELLIALKECWACFFTPAMQRYRLEAGIGNENLNVGVVAQRMPRGEISAESWSTTKSNTKEITVRTYLGAIDLQGDIEKDEFRLTREYLKPVFSSVAIQTVMLARDENDKLGKVALGPRGEEQKVNDRDVAELARLGKKASQALEKQVKLLFNVKDQFHLLLCNGILLTEGSVKLQSYQEEEQIKEEPPLFESAEEKSEVVEREEATVIADETESEIVDHHVEAETVDAETIEDEQSVEEPERADPVDEIDEPVAETEKTAVESEQMAQVEQTAEPPVEEIAEDEQVEEAEAVEETTEEPEQEEPEPNEEFTEDPIADEPVEETTEEPEVEDALEMEEPASQALPEDDSIFAGVSDQSPPEQSESIPEPEESASPEVEEIPQVEPAESEQETQNLEAEETPETPAETTVAPQAPERTLEEAYDEVMAALSARYEGRFRKPPPAEKLALFNELNNEIIIPHERLIGRFVRIMEEDAEHDQEEEERILAIIEEFLQEIK